MNSGDTGASSHVIFGWSALTNREREEGKSSTLSGQGWYFNAVLKGK